MSITINDTTTTPACTPTCPAASTVSCGATIVPTNLATCPSGTCSGTGTKDCGTTTTDSCWKIVDSFFSYDSAKVPFSSSGWMHVYGSYTHSTKTNGVWANQTVTDGWIDLGGSGNGTYLTGTVGSSSISYQNNNYFNSSTTNWVYFYQDYQYFSNIIVYVSANETYTIPGNWVWVNDVWRFDPQIWTTNTTCDASKYTLTNGPSGPTTTCTPSCSPACGQADGCNGYCASTDITTGYTNNCDGKNACGYWRVSTPGTYGTYNRWLDLTSDTSVGDETTAQCDGIDNDCDGTIDEACTVTCTPICPDASTINCGVTITPTNLSTCPSATCTGVGTKNCTTQNQTATFTSSPSGADVYLATAAQGGGIMMTAGTWGPTPINNIILSSNTNYIYKIRKTGYQDKDGTFTTSSTPQTINVTLTPTTTQCTPACTGKTCGASDGCNGTCTSANSNCTTTQCTPQCPAASTVDCGQAITPTNISTCPNTTCSGTGTKNCILPCTKNNYTFILTPTTCPSNQQQTKQYSKTGTCEGGEAQPQDTTIACTYNAPTCTYTYSNYTDCQPTGIKTRTVTNTTPQTCQGNPTELSVQCAYTPNCTDSDWLYQEGACQSNNIKTKTWVKSGNCTGGVTNPSTETITCVYASECTENNWSYIESDCVAEGKTRTWTKSGDCNGGVTHQTKETVDCTAQPLSNVTSEQPNQNQQSESSCMDICTKKYADIQKCLKECNITPPDINQPNTNAFCGDKKCDETEQKTGMCPTDCANNKLCIESDWNFTLEPEQCDSTGEQLKYWEKTTNCQGEVMHKDGEIIECEYNSQNTFGMVSELIDSILRFFGLLRE